MQDNESTELNRLERMIAARAQVDGAGLVPAAWRGQVSDLGADALQGFWVEAVRYAQWEIGRYRRWAEQEEPVLPSGYDAEGIVQACFERLVWRERGSVPILYSGEGIRRELQVLIKHRVRWLHERSETLTTVGEWDVLPAQEDGELVSIFDSIPGGIEAPDQEVMRTEKERLLGEFKKGFEGTLGNRRELVQVFRAAWEGERRREIAQIVGAGGERVKAVKEQLRRRLVKFCAKVQGGMKEMLEGVREGA